LAYNNNFTIDNNILMCDLFYYFICLIPGSFKFQIRPINNTKYIQWESVENIDFEKKKLTIDNNNVCVLQYDWVHNARYPNGTLS